MSKSHHTSRYKRLLSRLVEERDRRHWSQTTLAKKIGKSQTWVSNFERGQRRVDILELIDIADALGLDAAELVRDIQHPRR